MRILRFHGLILSIIIISSITIIVVDFLLATSLTLGHEFPDHIQLPVLALAAPAAGSQPNLQVASATEKGWLVVGEKRVMEGSKAPSIYSKILTVIISVGCLFILLFSFSTFYDKHLLSL